MLEALHKYAYDNSVTARPGFKTKNVKYYIMLSANGDFLDFDPVSVPPMCPDIGSLAQGNTKSNIIAEKAEVIFNIPEVKNGTQVYKREQKQKFYMSALHEASEYDPLFKVAVIGLENNFDLIKEEFSKLNKAKFSDVLSISVDGHPLESSSGYLEWWECFRKKFDTSRENVKKVRCFITGKLTEPVKTVPSIQGLVSVGGHTKGDIIICFDKDAYQSYGFEQAANAAVSEEAVTAVNASLTRLLKESPPPLAGAKHIHWFSEQTKNDVTKVLDVGFEIPNYDDEDDTQKEEDELIVQKMFTALMNNSLPDMPCNRYYMMSLSGVNGRVMIRSYDEGTYNDLCGNLRKWYEDIAIYIPNYGYKYPKLFGLYSRLLKAQKDSSKLSERIKNELSGLSSQIMFAIMHNTPLPDTVAARTLAYIRSDILSDLNDDTNPKKTKITQKLPDRTACQILKAWLNRRYKNQNKEEFLIMDKLNPQSPSAAYQAGRLMAEYAAIQSDALGDVNAGIVERYYTSACASPALVMGKLSTMSQYHLSKLKGEKKWLYDIHSKALEEISCKIGEALPKRFSLEQQSEFSLGYYFQCSEIRSRKSKKSEE
ncbi:MAG: type I-C CRISPR-associated protein Cas8c/Csd1 [Oscillospiraceae bacterium]|nr:type I-C CRISPR-associated protein Cas8c/Csd1 [Oscillospiraceae bacterium]